MNRVADGVWEISAPLRFMTFAVGTRMTVVRLSSGGLLLHSPIPIDADLKEKLAALGPVEHIVVPNLYHTLFALKAQELYPKAVVSAAKGVAKKVPDLRIDRELNEKPAPDWAAAFELVSFRGTMLNETMLFHRPSRVLITSDLLENFSGHTDRWTRGYLRLGGIYGKPGFHRMLRFLVFRDHKEVRRSLDRLLALDFESVIVAHGEIITTDAHKTVESAFAWLKNHQRSIAG